jgi:hypothetical protein
MQQALLVAMKIIVGIYNGATRSESVPILVNTLVVKGGRVFTHPVPK